MERLTKQKCLCNVEFGNQMGLENHLYDCDTITKNFPFIHHLLLYIDTVAHNNDSLDSLISVLNLLIDKTKQVKLNLNNQEFNVNDFDNFNIESETCSSCKIETNFDYLECLHQICKECLIKLLKENFNETLCPKCYVPITYQFKKQYLGESFESFEESAFKSSLKTNMVTCPNDKCKEQIAFDKGNIDYSVKTEKGESLNKKAAEHYASYRCRCPTCKLDFCTQCSTQPYHISYTCEEFKTFKKAVKCRFCLKVVTLLNKGPKDDVCNEKDCTTAFNMSCNKSLKCGHKCFGVKSETTCLPCLNKECKEYLNIFDQTEDSYCTICYSEGLSESPCILLSCGHYYHYKCFEARLKTKWVTPKITFNHLKCSQCTYWVETPNNPDLKVLIDESRKLYEKIYHMLKERVVLEKLDQDPRISTVGDPYYNKLEEYAFHKISYYLCSKCNDPYFAGMRECRGGPGEENQDANKIFDKNDLVCSKCVNPNGIPGVTKCSIHGVDYIDYKCRYCCDLACWFCFGTTHFCDKCHNRAYELPKLERNKLPKCTPETCKIPVKHPQNGEEYALGCSLCRYKH